MTDVDQIEWREPGPSRRGFGGGSKGIWVDRLKPLMHHPGRWAVVYTSDAENSSQKASGMAASLRGEASRKPPGKWEFTARQGEVFARYVGPE